VSQRRLLIALAVSLALNLFFLGVVAARAFRWNDNHPARGHGRDRPAAERPRGPRAEPQPWLSKAERDQLRPQRQALRRLRGDAEALLRAESFDAQAFRQSLSALREETARVQGSVHDVLVRRAEQLDLAERRRLADANWDRERANAPRGRRRE
jgi:uncharacterized membrane protein